MPSIRRFLGKLLKRGGPASRKKKAEFTRPHTGKGNWGVSAPPDIPCWRCRRVANRRKGVGRQAVAEGVAPCRIVVAFCQNEAPTEDYSRECCVFPRNNGVVRRG